jgi:hypothetical protein
VFYVEIKFSKQRLFRSGIHQIQPSIDPGRAQERR